MASESGFDANEMSAAGTVSHSAMSEAGRFPAEELEMLRGDLLQAGLDSWQAGDLIGSFLAARGYGVSSGEARSAVERIEQVGFTFESIQAEVEKLALVM